MLVLSRQRDESIVIGDDIVVTVIDLRGDKVRLGFTAPRDVAVHRKEVYDAIRREARGSATAPEANRAAGAGGADGAVPDGYAPGKGASRG